MTATARDSRVADLQPGDAGPAAAVPTARQLEQRLQVERVQVLILQPRKQTAQHCGLGRSLTSSSPVTCPLG